MDDRLAFLRAIRANPDDDVSRLVFADWLDEHDDPQGEFVRLQLELEAIRYRIDNPRARELHAREEALLAEHGDTWLGEAHDLTEWPAFGPVFRRGLPDYVGLSLDTFLEQGERLFAACPTVREVSLYGVATRCDELAASPLLAKLDTLEIADWPTRDDAQALVEWSYIHKVSRFKLWLGGQPYLYYGLLNYGIPWWPRAIELVQVYGGAACLTEEAAREQNAAADYVAAAKKEFVEPPAVRVSRPFASLFPLDGDLGHGLCAGHLPDGRPALAAGNFLSWVLLVFNEDGRIIETTSRDSAIPLDDLWRTNELDAALADWRNKELQLTPGLIWVRECSAENLSIELLPDYMREDVGNPDPYYPGRGYGGVTEWRERGGGARQWLEGRNFVITWGDDYFADWRGRIHSS